MKKILVAMLLSMGSGFALADDIQPMEGISLQLLTMKGVAYYTVEDDQFLVVATFMEDGASMPIRISASLRDGQKVVMSVPRGVGQQAEEVELVREANQLVMRTPGKKDLASLQLN